MSPAPRLPLEVRRPEDRVRLVPLPLPVPPLPVVPLIVPPVVTPAPVPVAAGRRPAVPLALAGALGVLGELDPVTSASPHTLQYPPSIVPPQPGWEHGVLTVVMSAPAGRVDDARTPHAGRSGRD